MDSNLDTVFAALADPTRRAILTMLLEDDMAVSDLAAPFEMSLAAIAKHVQVLERAGLVRRERRGRVTWCRLRLEALTRPALWMQSLGLLEPVNLDGLERFLAAELEADAAGG